MAPATATPASLALSASSSVVQTTASVEDGATMVCAAAHLASRAWTATVKSALTTVLTMAFADPTLPASATLGSVGLIAPCECARQTACTTEFVATVHVSVTPASTATNASSSTAWKTATVTVFVLTVSATAMLTMLHRTANTCGLRPASTHSLVSIARKFVARTTARAMVFASRGGACAAKAQDPIAQSRFAPAHLLALDTVSATKRRSSAFVIVRGQGMRATRRAAR